jgi:hypothetical protein
VVVHFQCLPDAHKAIGMNEAAFASLFKCLVLVLNTSSLQLLMMVL